ncbi:hypothetical protein V8E54_002055 [Elaphomyces granulatus]|jgi:hypothetical protein
MRRRLKFEREKTLDGWAESLDNAYLQVQRNDLAHSDMGMILADVDVLKLNYRQPIARKRWENAFREAYGVSFDEVRAENLSSKISVVMNRRASVLHLGMWRREHNLKRRNELLALADALITSWKKDKEIEFIEGSESRIKFDRIEKLWEEGYLT